MASSAAGVGLRQCQQYLTPGSQHIAGAVVGRTVPCCTHYGGINYRQGLLSLPRQEQAFRECKRNPGNSKI